MFFLCREARKVHPRARAAFAKIVAVGFDGAEGDSPQSMQFEDLLSSFWRCSDVNIRLLTDADLVA
jgi:hypothetical protein